MARNRLAGRHSAARELLGRHRPFRATIASQLRQHGQAMHTRPKSELNLLPGDAWVLFLVQLDGTRAVLAVCTAKFLEGLAAADAMLSFTGLHRDDDSLDELLPWTGSV